MKKVGIITFSWAHNYGALLQTYALQKKISENNEVKIINFKKKEYINQYKLIPHISGSFSKKIKGSLKSILFFNKNLKRYLKFSKFINNNICFTELYNTEDELKENPPKYDVYITGSDQVWNPRIVGELSDAYTLNFGDETIKRISYAASVGNSLQILQNIESFTRKLSILDYISVREEDAKNELSKIINKNIQVVLDPTLLLTKEEWEDNIYNNKKVKEKYILAYVVEEDAEYNKIVNELSIKTGLKVIHFEKRNNKYNNVLKNAYTEGPLEFVNYIKNAEYVVATSFHATIFSVIFNKKFFIIPHKKTGARVTNILNKLGISGRTFYNLDEFNKIDYDFETDWDSVNKKLEEERKKSIDWLENSINDDQGVNNV